MTSFKPLALLLTASLALAGPALAGELQVWEPEPTVETGNAGLYLGLIGGYALMTGNLGNIDAVPLGSPTEISLEGYSLGLQSGGEAHVNSHIVVGVSGDVSWTNISGKSCVEQTDPDCSEADPDHSYLEARIDWLATLRARVGVDLGSALVYATAGVAAGHVAATITNAIDSTDLDGAAMHYGYAAGLGARVKLADNLSAGLEYLYLDLGSADYSFNVLDDVGQASITANTVRGSLNLQF